MLNIITGLLGSTFGRMLAACAVGFAVLKAYGYHQQNKGAATAVAKIDEKERKHNNKARRARNASRANGGVYDPYTRTD